MITDDINIPQEIDRLLEHRPFDPFTIVMTSGEKRYVTYQHAAAVGKSVIILIEPRARVSTYLRISQIASLSVGVPDELLGK
jgi:hypothetical protein